MDVLIDNDDQWMNWFAVRAIGFDDGYRSISGFRGSKCLKVLWCVSGTGTVKLSKVWRCVYLTLKPSWVIGECVYLNDKRIHSSTSDINRKAVRLLIASDRLTGTVLLLLCSAPAQTTFSQPKVPQHGFKLVFLHIPLTSQYTYLLVTAFILLDQSLNAMAEHETRRRECGWCIRKSRRAESDNLYSYNGSMKMYNLMSGCTTIKSQVAHSDPCLPFAPTTKNA